MHPIGPLLSLLEALDRSTPTGHELAGTEAGTEACTCGVTTTTRRARRRHLRLVRMVRREP